MKCEFQEKVKNAEGKTLKLVCKFLKQDCPYVGDDMVNCPTGEAFDTVKP